MNCYDAVFMLKAGAEKAQSLEPKAIAAVLPTVKFQSFYGDNLGLGGKAVYGMDMQPAYPVFIMQIGDGKLAERAKIASKY
jgi:branched-chain amino acid transport system substrate-binding protein